MNLLTVGRALPIRTVSNAKGEFRFLTTASGEYSLRVELKGYFTADYAVALKPRQTLQVRVELVPRKGPEEEVEVVATYGRLDPGQTETSQMLTHRSLQALPANLTRDIPTLAENFVPGAVAGHDNFIHLRGNELSLHEFINGVSFLDNSHPHFTAGISPQIFEAANFVTGGFPAEFGNRFGGILDITTRSATTLTGHGSFRVGAGTALNHDVALEYGASRGRLGYYGFLSGSESGRFLNPPTSHEIHDLGKGLKGTFQIDYRGDRDSLKLFFNGGGNNFELPNTVQEAEVQRDAFRRIRSQTAILTWQHTLSPDSTVTTSFYQRVVSDRLLGTTDPLTPLGEGSRSTLTVGAKSDLVLSRAGHIVKAGLDFSLFRLRESFFFAPRESALEAVGS
ncbi:MAG: hypothetical protein ACE5JX_22585, partial [Acidobacteriota bacterium]